MGIWAEIKKSINSDLNTPLNVLIENGVIGGYQLFTSSGDFKVPKGVKKILVTAIGSGGGGGGSGSAYCFNVDNSNGYYKARSATGGGGGSGEFIIDEPFAVNPGTTIPITINARGVAGTGARASANANGVAGGNGGKTIVGDLLSVNGGIGGGGATYVKVASSYRSEDNITGVEGSAGTGGVRGRRGSRSEWQGNTSPFSNVPGGAGGVASAVFGGAYGKGGIGGDSIITETTAIWHGGKNGNAGTSGAVLICWGQFDHDTVY